MQDLRLKERRCRAIGLPDWLIICGSWQIENIEGSLFLIGEGHELSLKYLQILVLDDAELGAVHKSQLFVELLVLLKGQREHGDGGDHR